VRDFLLKKKAKDFDIASDASPEQVARYFPKTVPVGAQFGVMIVLQEGQSFEVATFRADKGYVDGRRPTGVRFTDAKEDAIRRDFTVNGLFYDPVTKKILDWVGGRDDLKKKVIRAIGDPVKRFEEDKLRMLRAVRFASVLGFKIDPKTFAAVKKLSKKISSVSHERVRDELVKMFTGPRPALALELLDKSGLLAEVLPEVSRMKGVKQPKKYHPEGDVFVHTKLLLVGLENAPADLALGCLLHDIGKPPTYKRSDRIRFNGHDRVGARMAEEVMRRLKFPNDLTARVVACVDGHMRFKDVKAMRESTLKKFMQRDTFDTELAQHRLDCLASHGDLSNWRFLKAKKKKYGAAAIRPEPLVTGRDVMELCYKEGPVIGKILRAAEEAQLDGEIATREAAYAWIKAKFPLL
jgi:poly(A) polymerase